MEQVTYGALKKPSARSEMLEEKVVSLGNQAGNYGLFTEQARILTLIGAKEIKEELRKLAVELGYDITCMLRTMPTLEKLIK
ncbi:MAG: hypothetical protein Unbinned5350contig1004_8 [Prokaryotic dsDNA virus sp.]|nr:MAG: hypothetical protein Unbinned5350contig1004_8 [Prokaryotic dsDNA virus sp.]|tara:strand:- start:25103 stop:25348 length:246 start_codon:yes stop_codon:yes gene_type:complete